MFGDVIFTKICHQHHQEHLYISSGLKSYTVRNHLRILSSQYKNDWRFSNIHKVHHHVDRVPIWLGKAAGKVGKGTRLITMAACFWFCRRTGWCRSSCWGQRQERCSPGVPRRWGDQRCQQCRRCRGGAQRRWWRRSSCQQPRRSGGRAGGEGERWQPATIPNELQARRAAPVQKPCFLRKLHTLHLNFPWSKLQFSSILTLFSSPTCSFVHHPSSTSLSSRYRQWGSGNVLEGLFRWLTCVQLFDKYLFKSSNVFLRVRWYMKDKTYDNPVKTEKKLKKICLMFFNSARSLNGKRYLCYNITIFVMI